MNDVDFPVARGARRHRRRARGRACARSRSTWWSSAAPTTTRSCRWRAISRAAATSLRFIEYMDVGRIQRLAHGRSGAVGRGGRTHPCANFRSRRSMPTTGRSGRALALCRRRRRDRRDSSVTQAFCATARARGCRPKASSIPACSPRKATTCAPVAGRGRRCRDCGGDGRNLEPAQRSLFGNSNCRDGRVAEDRDVVYRRLVVSHPPTIADPQVDRLTTWNNSRLIGSRCCAL